MKPSRAIAIHLPARRCGGHSLQSRQSRAPLALARFGAAESMVPTGPTVRAGSRGRTLARANGSGAPITFASYLDTKRQIGSHASGEGYADQNDQDYDEFVKAIRPSQALESA